LVRAWAHPDGVKSGHSGSSRRLPNGNTIIGWGSNVDPSVTEVNELGEIVWEMTHDEATYMYRAHRIVWDEQAATESASRVNVVSYGTYEFNDFNNETGVSLTLGNVWGETGNKITVGRSPFTPSDAVFADPEPKAYQTTIEIVGVAIDSFEATARLDLSTAPYVELPDEAVVFFRESGADTFRQVPTTRLLSPDALEFDAPGFGEYVFGVPIDESASHSPLLVEPAQDEIVDSERSYEFLWSPRGVSRAFDVEIDTSAAFDDPLVAAYDLPSARYSFQPEQDEQTYYWRVRAKNRSGTSDWSGTRSFEAATPFVEFRKPVGGELFERFSDVLVSVKHNLHRRTFVVELWRDGSVVETVLDDPLQTGGFLWDVGGTEPGEGYELHAFVKDDPTLRDSSGVFAIAEPNDAEEGALAPSEFSLAPAFPNPFNPATTIGFALPERASVALRIFDVSGRLIRSCDLGDVPAGRRRVVWDGTDDRGARAASGVYLYRLEAIGESGERFVAHDKMVMLK
jgi:hypothetical protein